MRNTGSTEHRLSHTDRPSRRERTHKGTWFFRNKTCPSRHIASRAAIASDMPSTSRHTDGILPSILEASLAEATCIGSGVDGDVEQGRFSSEFNDLGRLREVVQVTWLLILFF